ncbi:hypothetical protein ACP4OV_002796 [Aristida adscensionis]
MASSSGVCMAGGDGETSYARNSDFQGGMQSKLIPLVEEAISDLCGGAAAPGCLRVADLGCASGPNALALVSAAVAAGAALPPPGGLPSFLREHGEAERAAAAAGGGGGGLPAPLVMVFAAPGSFYGRLFPAETLHLAFSSLSLHWLSQVPQELVDGVLVNRGSVSAGRTCAPAVAAAYARQFEQDFVAFLSSRSEEMVAGGRMVLSLMGRPARDLSSQDRYPEFVAEILHDMASQGVIEAEAVDAYNQPFYTPREEELVGVVEREGSFALLRMESHGFEWRGPRGDKARAAAMARFLRVLEESTLARHFRVDGVGDEYQKAAERRYMGPGAEEDMAAVVLVVSLVRRTK